MNDRRSRVIWRFTDGKPGHEKQSAGLIKALQKLEDCEVLSFPAREPAACLIDLLFKRPPVPDTEPRPDLAVGAGHATHLSLLAAQRATGCRSVVLMKPSLPLNWFDACLIPEHDGVPEDPHVIPTEGALNSLANPAAGKKDTGLILLGGPSKHFVWDDDAILRQIRRITEQTAGIPWHLCTSRRTPERLTTQLNKLQTEYIKLMSHTACPPGWLDKTLPTCRLVWVSADSVSMIYESLTAGAEVGVIELERKRDDKITRAIDALNAKNMVTLFRDWANGQPLHAPKKVLNEAQRCAELLQQRFFSEQTS